METSTTSPPVVKDESKPEFRCPQCDETFDECDAETVYECQDCGTTFNRDNSSDGNSHRCPDCNKFAAKLTDNGCPHCGEAEGEQNTEPDEPDPKPVAELLPPKQPEPESQPEPVQTTSEPNRTRLTPRRGFFPLHRADIARIRELGESDDEGVSIPVLIAVWAALCDIANETHSTRFDVGVGIIRHRAGVSRKTAFNALAVLERRLKMLKRTENIRKTDKGKKVQEDNTYTIFQTKERAKGRENKALPQSNKNPTPSVNEEALPVHTGFNKTDEDGYVPHLHRGDKETAGAEQTSSSLRGDAVGARAGSSEWGRRL